MAPETEYRCNSLRILRLSGKCFVMTAATTSFEYLIPSCERMFSTRLKNCDASFGLEPLILKSITEQREWIGSMIRFLKLHVKMNEQFDANSSMAPRRAG